MKKQHNPKLMKNSDDKATKVSPEHRRRRSRSHGLENLPGPWVVALRTDGIVVDASAAMESILLEPKDQLLGRALMSFSAQSAPSGWSARPIDLAMLERPGRYEDVLVQRSDHSEIIVDLHIAPLQGVRGTTACVCLFTDRTEQRRLGAELISKHQQLRRAFAELEQRQQDLEAARATLERSNRELARLSTELSRASELAAIGEITAELTHQLNNPLAAAVGAARRIDTLLQRNPGQQGTGPMMELLHSSLERLKSTISELRRVYRDSRPSDTEAQWFDLGPQVRSALTLLQDRLTSMRLTVEVSESLPKILGQPTNTQHIIVNLVDNAIHAAGKDGALAIRALATDDGVVRLGIGDSGPGVPASLVERIFEPFFTLRADGSGLGLSFVRRHLDQDGATIRVGRSELGGALFEIAFRAATLESDKERRDE
jgi:C4-dicarboxylate-specific signal transduction histidine kinase